MFAFNDAWLINESLALHMSTNTFNNPAFDTDFIDYDDGLNGGARSKLRVHDNHPSASIKSAKRRVQEKTGTTTTTTTTISGQEEKENETITTISGKNQYKKDNFANNLAFSIRSKLFVIDLNFKRKLRSLKAFVFHHFPGIFIHQSRAATYKRKANNNINYYFDNNNVNSVNLEQDNKNNNNNNNGSFRTRCNFVNSSRTKNKIHDVGFGGGSMNYNDDYDDDNDHEQFWKNIIVEANSRKSLGKQKEKILNRLERALEQKRNHYNMENKHQCSNYNQYLNNNTKTTNQFGQATTTNSNGLRQIRPRIVGHPLESSQISTESQSADVQTQSLFSGLKAEVGGGVGGGEPMIIGPQQRQQHQNWANQRNRKDCYRGNNKKSRHTTAAGSGGDKWRQIRDIVFDDDDDSAESANSKKLCIVCYTNVPNIVTLPCKHDDVCSDCFIEMIYISVKKSQYPLKCAICRQKVERIRCSKKLLLSVIEKQRIYP